MNERPLKASLALSGLALWLFVRVEYLRMWGFLQLVIAWECTSVHTDCNVIEKQVLF